MSISLKAVLTFVMLIVIGAAALMMPDVMIETSDAQHSRLISALFTSTSAVCVTGLACLDTCSDFTIYGKAIILMLIQLGGIGIMTMSNIVLLSLKNRMDLNTRLEVAAIVGGVKKVDPNKILKQMLVFTFLIEGAGAVILFLRFLFNMDPMAALSKAVFHSVSAFCNAGFSTFPNSLIDYRNDPVVSLTIAALIVAGGLGFVVFSDLWSMFRKPKAMQWRNLSLHTRIVLTTSFCLILGGTILFFIIELNNPKTLGTCAWYGKPLSAMFMSVTTRTAGFNTVSIGDLTDMSLIIVMVLMYIGASPGSTGGGIKTTTFAILLAMVYSRMKGRQKIEIGNRSVPFNIVAKSLATAAAFLIIIFFAFFLVSLFELGDRPHSSTGGQSLNYLFEVVSALGTVGLSTGVTPMLGDASRIIIVLCMFVGRVGPLLLANSLIGQRKTLAYTLPEENINVG